MLRELLVLCEREHDAAPSSATTASGAGEAARADSAGREVGAAGCVLAAVARALLTGLHPSSRLMQTLSSSWYTGPAASTRAWRLVALLSEACPGKLGAVVASCLSLGGGGAAAARAVLLAGVDSRAVRLAVLRGCDGERGGGCEAVLEEALCDTGSPECENLSRLLVSDAEALAMLSRAIETRAVWSEAAAALMELGGVGGYALTALMHAVLQERTADALGMIAEAASGAEAEPGAAAASSAASAATGKAAAAASAGGALGAVNELGQSALWLAALVGQEAVCVALLAAGCSGVEEDAQGETAVCAACRCGHAAIATRIIEAELEAGRLERLGFGRRRKKPTMVLPEHYQTAIVHAARCGLAEVVRALFDVGCKAEVGVEELDLPCPLLAACENGQEETAMMLVDFLPARLLGVRNALGRTPVWLAASQGMDGLTKLLLSRKVHAARPDSEGTTVLAAACEEGHSGCALAVLASGSAGQVSKRDAGGRTALWHAAATGLEDVCRALLVAGADAGIADDENVTPLMAACENGFAGVADALLEAGGAAAAAAAADAEGRTALGLAAATGMVATVERLLAAGCDAAAVDEDGTTALMAACAQGEGEAALSILRAVHGEPPSGDAAAAESASAASSGADATDESGRSALWYACQGGCAGAVVEALLRAGASPLRADDAGVTPLMAACGAGSAEVAELLLRRAEVVEAIDASDEEGRTALHSALLGGEEAAVVEALVRGGCGCGGGDDAGVTPLMLAAEAGRAGVVRLLLSTGRCGDLNSATKQGHSAVWFAAQSGSTETLGALLAAPAGADGGAEGGDRAGGGTGVRVDAAAASRSGVTPLMAACDRGAEATALALLDTGRFGPVDARDKQRRTALHYAAASGLTAVALRLIACGAAADAVDRDGMTPLMRACSSARSGVAEALARSGRPLALGRRDEERRTAAQLADAAGMAGIASLLRGLEKGQAAPPSAETPILVPQAAGLVPQAAAATATE